MAQCVLFNDWFSRLNVSWINDQHKKWNICVKYISSMSYLHPWVIQPYCLVLKWILSHDMHDFTLQLMSFCLYTTLSFQSKWMNHRWQFYHPQPLHFLNIPIKLWLEHLFRWKTDDNFTNERLSRNSINLFHNVRQCKLDYGSFRSDKTTAFHSTPHWFVNKLISLSFENDPIFQFILCINSSNAEI